ncbi:hypothetical protein ACFX2B_031951 [Malus domestica]
MAVDNRTIKKLSASGLDNALPLCIQYPRAAQNKTDEFELKSSLLHHIPKFHGLSMEDPNKHLKEFEHQMKEELLLQYFYKGLLPIERQRLDASVGGALMDKTPMAAKTLIGNRALNAQQYEGIGQRDNPWQQQVNEVVEKPKEQSVAACGVCSMNGHLTDKCPQLIENRGWESANAVGFGSQNQPRNDPFSDTYNPGWKDHPNFKWREPQQTQQQSAFRQQPPGFYQRPYAPTQPQTQPAQNNSGSSFDNAQVI